VYTEATYNEYLELYGELRPGDVERRLDALDQSGDKVMAYREILVYLLTDNLARGSIEYGPKFKWPEEMDAYLCIIERQIDRGIDGADYYEAFVAFVKDQRKRCLETLAVFLNRVGKETPINEGRFDLDVVTPFKEGFPGFYTALKGKLDRTSCEELVFELCDALEAYYKTGDMDERSDIMADFLQRRPESVVAQTCLGMAHYAARRWGPAIACFEKLEDTPFLPYYHDDDLYFFKAVAYTKLREHENAIVAYEKTIEIYPQAPFALNNLGYEYYLTKQYSKALETFKRCIDEKMDVRYAANNYLRTLIAMKRLTEAKTFAGNPPAKLAPAMVRRLEKALAGKVDEADSQEAEAPDEGAGLVSFGPTSVVKREDAKNGQFFSERLLEEELTQRIESGLPVFGRQLKVYRRHGEYGRQYIIPIGRLDLLAEDEVGNLYIIELKKDGGYDDAYAQLVNYMDWFEKNRRKEGGQVRGILCVNNPPKRMIKAVRNDGRVQLFNYQIAYEEIT